MKLVYTRGEPGVHAWDLPTRPDPRTLDVEIYQKLLLRAAQTLLSPFGVSQQGLRKWTLDRAVSLPLTGFQIRPEMGMASPSQV